MSYDDYKNPSGMIEITPYKNLLQISLAGAGQRPILIDLDWKKNKEEIIDFIVFLHDLILNLMGQLKVEPTYRIPGYIISVYRKSTISRDIVLTSFGSLPNSSKTNSISVTSPYYKQFVQFLKNAVASIEERLTA